VELRIDNGRDSLSNVLSARLLVDGQDVLPDSLRGVDPDCVLPPLSAALLPSSVGRTAMVGTCCVPGCASFSIQVRRVGSTVLWEPDPRALDETLGSVLDFALLPYLEAVDAAATDPQLQERGRRLARAVELRLRAQHDKHGQSERELVVPMAWQTKDEVSLLYRDRHQVLHVADLPEDDTDALLAIFQAVYDRQTLPPPTDSH